MNNRFLSFFLLAACFVWGLGYTEALNAQNISLEQLEVPEWARNSFSVAAQQAEKMYEEVERTSLLPRSIAKGMVNAEDWTAGFFRERCGTSMPIQARMCGAPGQKRPQACWRKSNLMPATTTSASRCIVAMAPVGF